LQWSTTIRHSQVARYLLESAEYTASLSPLLLQCLKALPGKDRLPDLDIDMAVMDGFDLAQGQSKGSARVAYRPHHRPS
jgi:hypothetical protein